MICYVITRYVMLYNICCYITHDMLYNTCYNMCDITHDMLCYRRNVTLYNR